MTGLPEGWESDYDGTRWLYRYKATGLTQFHFPRLGDEFPELVGLGFGPLDLTPENKFGGQQSPLGELKQNQIAGRPNGNGETKMVPASKKNSMSATGYFDPDQFIYFGLNDSDDEDDTAVHVNLGASLIKKNDVVLAELPEEFERVRSPLGFVAELADGDTIKSAEELAPVELDAMQLVPAALQPNIQQNQAELSTRGIRTEQPQPIQQPNPAPAEQVNKYPLVSASFAYPPLNTMVKPAQGTANGEPRPPNRQSIALSNVSVLQSQNSELGPIEPKRHSLSEPIAPGANSRLPNVPRPPSGPKVSTVTSLPLQAKPEPIPAVSRPAAGPTDNSPHGATPLPRSGAKYDGITMNLGPVIANSNTSQAPTQVLARHIRPGAHRVNATGAFRVSKPPKPQASPAHNAQPLVTTKPPVQASTHMVNNQSQGHPGQTASSPSQGSNSHQPQAKPHVMSSQASPMGPTGKHTLTHNQRPPSIPKPPQPPSQATQHVATMNTQSKPPMNSIPGPQMPSQASSHGSSPINQASHANTIPNKPSVQQSTGLDHQKITQRPPRISPLGNRPPSTQPAAHAVSPGTNQNSPVGMVTGQNKPQSLPSPITNPVSPAQSQVSSPTPSIASIYRPPSSASSHTQMSVQGVVAQNRPPIVASPQSQAQIIRPTGQQVSHAQGNAQTSQSSNNPVNGPSKPFPMLPGQVTPLPSQVRPTPIPIQAQPVHASPAQIQNQQGHMGPIKPQQQQGNQQIAQVAAQRPPQQQHLQGHQTSIQGAAVSGQGLMQHGQPRPPVPMTSAQQQSTIQATANGQNMGMYVQQNTGQVNQSPHHQIPLNPVQGTQVQQQVSHTGQHSNTMSSQTSPTQSYLAGQVNVQGQVSGFQPGLPQAFGQNKPFTSTQAAAALSGAGKKMKKWAKKTWQNPALKQTAVAVSGAIIAESMDGDAVAGAVLANQIFSTSQSKPPQGAQQPQRPPGPQHANTAPPQAQGVASATSASLQIQAVNRPQFQQGMQPTGVQTPGRPPAVQNQGMVGATANNTAASQPRPNMVQRPPNQPARPPVGRPPPPQMQQQQRPGVNSQPIYQPRPNQPMVQAQAQAQYQVRPNQQFYKGRPNQPPYQMQGGPDPYVALGATIGGALNVMASNNHDSGDPSNPEQHHAADAEPQQESYSSQHYADQSEQHNESHMEQHDEGHAEQYHTEQTEQNHETYPEQHTGNPEQQYESYAEQDHATYSEQQHPSSTETRQEPHPEQQNTTYAEEGGYFQAEFEYTESQATTHNPESEFYSNPQAETTIINNDNTNTNTTTNMTDTFSAHAEAGAFTDTSYADASNANVEGSMYVDASSYADPSTANANFEGSAYFDASYADTTDMAAYTDTSAYVDASYTDTGYVDASYTDASYADASYADETAVDVNGDANVDMGDEGCMMAMEGSVDAEVEMEVEVEASYEEAVEVDYSGGDWDDGGE
ncbi:hypothetical protein M426DRAFT_113017 [Hypoxylon sp. CI-4A]|nr:hypothetical protein M426DRAFT_113017 [Hypoxylon sp. CI-4A]